LNEGIVLVPAAAGTPCLDADPNPFNPGTIGKVLHMGRPLFSSWERFFSAFVSASSAARISRVSRRFTGIATKGARPGTADQRNSFKNPGE
jgi:hypothetical protein